MKDIHDVMEILREKEEVTVEDILDALDGEMTRTWVIKKAGRLCRQYPFMFDRVYDGKKVKGYRKKTRRRNGKIS